MGIRDHMDGLRIRAEQLDVHDAVVDLMDLPYLCRDEELLQLFDEKI